MPVRLGDMSSENPPANPNKRIDHNSLIHPCQRVRVLKQRVSKTWTGLQASGDSGVTSRTKVVAFATNRHSPIGFLLGTVSGDGEPR